MWRILFNIVLLVTVAKASPQYTNDLSLEDMTGINLLNKIGMLAWEIISGILFGQPSTELILNNPKSCPSCSCGALGFKEKIIGGEKVEYAHKYPWMALLLRKGSFTCGASLINDKYVLTAGHCVDNSQVSDYKVRLSVHDRNTDIFEEYNAKRIIRHKNYITDGGFVFNDIALIRLDTDGIKMNKDVHPICMPEKGRSYDNVIGLATGWGLTEEKKPSNVLRETELHVLGNSECRPFYYNLITQNMVCAGLRDEGKSTCQGDSGGPLTVANGSVHHIIGITSFGVAGCRSPPSVYTRVSEYLGWIKANTKDACSCHDNYTEWMS